MTERKQVGWGVNKHVCIGVWGVRGDCEGGSPSRDWIKIWACLRWVGTQNINASSTPKPPSQYVRSSRVGDCDSTVSYSACVPSVCEALNANDRGVGKASNAGQRDIFPAPMLVSHPATFSTGISLSTGITVGAELFVCGPLLAHSSPPGRSSARVNAGSRCLLLCLENDSVSLWLDAADCELLVICVWSCGLATY